MYIHALDPGSNYIGLGIIELDNNFNLIRWQTALLPIGEYTDNYPLLTDRYAMLEILLMRYIKAYPPIYAITENNYLNANRVSAYKPLIESVANIERIYRDNFIQLNRVQPNVVKRGVGVRDVRDKEATKVAMSNHLGNLNYLVEDEVDALSIVYWLYLKIKSNPLFLYNRFVVPK